MSADFAGGGSAESDYRLLDTRRGADTLALILMFVFLIDAVTLSLMPVVTDQLQSGLGLSNSQIGLLTTVFLAVYGVSGITSGIGAARWGGWLIGVCCSCFVLGSLIFGLSSGMPGFIVGRALQGLGGGMVIATSSPVLAHAVPSRWLVRSLGILGCGWGLGEMVALLVMPSIQNAGGYRAVFLTTAGLAFVIGLAALSQRAIRTRPKYPEGATTFRGLATALGSVITNRKVLLLSLVNAAALAIGVVVLVWTPKFLQNIHGSDEAISLYLVAGLGVAQTLGNPLGAVATARWGKYAVIVSSVTVMLVATALIGFVPGIPLVFIMVLLVGFFSMTYFPPMIGFMPEVVAKPWQVGPATGLNTSLGFLGSTLFPWFFGLLLDAGQSSRGSYVVGYLMLAAVGVVSVVGMLFFSSRKKQPA